MNKIGIPDSFSRIVMMLLQDASATVLLNGKPTPPFAIQRGVRPGCPLAPYPFLIVAEALHMAASVEQRLGKIHGISLPDSDLQQLVAQYVDDTGLSVIGRESDLRNTISLLDRFGGATGLILNWTKSIAY